MEPGGSDCEILVDREEIEAAVQRLARAIEVDHRDGVVLVGVLRGAVFLLADLARHLHVPVLVDVLAVTPYAPGTGRVRLLKDLDIDVSERDVVLVEDIVDTGLTLSYVQSVLEARGPRRVRICTLLDRDVSRIVPLHLDYVGFRIPDVFVVGYGLDHQGRYRNAPLVASAHPTLLDRDPDACLDRLYGGR